MERPSLVWVQCETILEDTIMKMFKKLMAVALAGVMALAVLTGCGSSLNEKELIKMMNDGLVGTTSSVKEFKADNEMAGKAKATSTIVAEKAKKEADIKNVLASEDVKKVFVGEKDTNQYRLSYVKKATYSSKYYNAHKDSINLSEIYSNGQYINSVADYEGAKDAVVLVGFADVNVDGSVYTIVAMKYPTQKKA